MDASFSGHFSKYTKLDRRIVRSATSARGLGSKDSPCTVITISALSEFGVSYACYIRDTCPGVTGIPPSMPLLQFMYPKIDLGGCWH